MIYIALLRGINVSGQKIIKMADLSSLCKTLGFDNVRTYLQSGNVVFDYKKSDSLMLGSIISKEIQRVYGFDVPVIIKTKSELENIVSQNPFLKNHSAKTDFLYTTFLIQSIKSIDISAINLPKTDNEKFVIHENEVFLYCPNGYGKTKLNNNTFEKKLKTVATTRNWKTLIALLEIATGKHA